MADVETTRILDGLVAPAAAGDPRAMAEILRIISPLMRRYCATRLGRLGDLHVTADDVSQEICMATMKALPRYEDQGKSFLSFVYGIAAHKVADARRRAQLHPLQAVEDAPEQVSTDTGPEERALAGEKQLMVRELMEILSPTHKEVLVMRVVMGWSAAETADALGTSAGVVRVMQHRALNRLRAELRRTEQPRLESTAYFAA